jgi:ppGpp synthetase/RelA/SpoT-type nucleotidyltranferase
MNEVEFLSKYRSEIPLFQSWGHIVNAQILDSLKNKLGDIKKVEIFLKIPPKPRIKDFDSIISKAFFRDKNYKNPYEDITDKVGVRYVLLLRDQIGIICEIVEHNDLWVHSKDRDFEDERIQNPLIFDYQSVHYIVRNKFTIKENGIVVPPGTPCEIQIRTLLQHACCELTHDTIYKPKMRSSNPTILRSIAKSRALTESTDDIFMEVNVTLQNENKQINSFLSSLKSLYSCITTADIEEKTNLFILDAFNELLPTINISDIEQLITESPALKDIVSKKAQTSFLYKQPVVLFLYFLIQRQRTTLKRLWPLTESEIKPLFTDLGIAF